MEYIEIYGKKHKIIGIKEDRVIFQAVEPDWRNKKSYKIRYDCHNGYYILIPKNCGRYEYMGIDEVLKYWQLYQDIKEDIKTRKNYYEEKDKYGY